MIKAIIFDMDDTLFPEEEFILSGFVAVDQFLLSKGISGFYDVANRFHFEGVRGKIFNKTLDELFIDYNNKDIHELLYVYRNHWPNINLYEDAKWVFRNLGSSYDLGLISDGYLSTQKLKAQALNLSSHIKTLIFTDEYGREFWKPSNKAYEEIMKKLNCDGNECLYIGDNPFKDFISAKRLGWQTIHVQRHNGEYNNCIVLPEYEADYKIKSLYNLPKVLSTLL